MKDSITKTDLQAAFIETEMDRLGDLGLVEELVHRKVIGRLEVLEGIRRRHSWTGDKNLGFSQHTV